MTARVYGQLPDGTVVHEVTLGTGDLSVSVLTLGAIIRDVRLKGVEHPLVLGFNTAPDYLKPPYFGALAGRYGNRIGGGRFMLDGVKYQLTLNENGKTH